jgi:DNA-binding transcriptional MerR regulator
MQKNKNAYKTISEAAKEIGLVNKKNNTVNTHTLRFWEKSFKQIKPKILSGNRRYYSQKDISFLKLIYDLLKKQGFTIRGAKKILNLKGNKLDESLEQGIKKKTFYNSLKKRAKNIKFIVSKIKSFN